MQIDLSQRGHTPLQAEEGQIQAKAQTHNSGLEFLTIVVAMI